MVLVLFSRGMQNLVVNPVGVLMCSKVITYVLTLSLQGTHTSFYLLFSESGRRIFLTGVFRNLEKDLMAVLELEHLIRKELLRRHQGRKMSEKRQQTRSESLEQYTMEFRKIQVSGARVKNDCGVRNDYYLNVPKWISRSKSLESWHHLVLSLSACS